MRARGYAACMSTTEEAIDPGLGAEAAISTRFIPRALGADRTYWFAMFAASALGTNLGDFSTHYLGRTGSFGSLLAICAVAVWGDRRIARRSEASYWVAVVALRAAATNVADFMTEDLKLGFAIPALVLVVVALLAGAFTRPAVRGGGSPLVNGSYWTAMLVAGVFGTVAGDFTSHSFGLYAAAALLVGLLLVLLAVRAWIFPGAMLAYWVAVLAERCAGTPVGDALASRHAMGLGLPLATCCTTGLFLVALFVRQRLRP
jgi:uncharacterized membrane-anchored protein